MGNCQDNLLLSNDIDVLADSNIIKRKKKKKKG
mgnify:CR=1 FL=1